MDPNKGVTPEAGRRGHEERDIGLRGPVIFGLILLAGLVVSYALNRALFHAFAAREELAQEPVHALAGGAGAALPPEPRLQMNPVDEFRKIRAAESALLNGYGWIDKEAGIAHIPIERAMQLLAENPPPARSGPGAEPESLP